MKPIVSIIMGSASDWKVMEKAGMSTEGVLRKAGRNNQGIFDLVMYSILKEDYEKDDSLKIYLEDGKIKVKGTINLGYIGSFKDSQIELEDSLEDIREWDIIEEYYNPECSDDELIDYCVNNPIDKILSNSNEVIFVSLNAPSPIVLIVLLPVITTVVKPLH